MNPSHARPDNRRRILLLSSSTGSGHDRRAEAFRNWVEELYPDQFEVRQEQIIENSSRLGAFGVWLYNQIQRHGPIAHNLYWEIVELFTATHSQSVSYGGRYYRELLQSYRPHLVLSLHDCTNRGYFQDARKVLGDSVRTMTYCGEWSGGRGFSVNWAEPSVDRFVARTNAARMHAIELGVPADKASVLTNFLPRRALGGSYSLVEKKAARQSFGLHPERFTVFISTGSQGASHHLRFLRSLLPLADRVQAIVVCGRNEKACEQVRAWHQRHPQLALHLEGFSRRMPELMRASDCVVTRGGANTAAEALQAGCPVVFHTLGGMMPQERLTVQYFQAQAAGELVHNEEELEKLLARWLDRPGDYQRLLHRFRQLRADDRPEDLLHDIAEMLGVRSKRAATAHELAPVAAVS
ncbi:MAG: glycosyltransferase [Verrucomicrobiota bacterium JB022]|nr:glycosyltransferase [Verrucomicrobiota bacterium JB022]